MPTTTLRLPIILLTATVLTGVALLIAMHRCRPEAEYRREAATLEALRLGSSREAVERTLAREFRVLFSDDGEVRLASELELDGACGCAPAMVNVVSLGFVDGRLAATRWHDAVDWPVLRAVAEGWLDWQPPPFSGSATE